jgi:hypothetical protein
MTNYFTNSFQEQVTTVIRSAVQQGVSRLRSTVTVSPYQGSNAQVADYIKLAAAPLKNVASKSDTNYGDIDTTRRWIYGDTYRAPAILVDQLDKLKTLNDPSGSYSQAIIKAMAREQDQVINASLFAAAKTGVTGSGSTIFPTSTSTNVVAVTEGAAAATGLNFQKITKGLQLLRKNQVDLNMEELYMPVTAKLMDDLINDPEINNKMYGGLLDYSNGTLNRIMGVNLVYYEYLDLDASSYVNVPLYAKSGVQLGIWKDVAVTLTPQVATKNNNAQISCEMMIGATRVEEEKVIQIKCVA